MHLELAASRRPQMDTLATPSTPIRRGAMVQRASTEMSMSDIWLAVRPISMTRFDDDNGLSMVGGAETFGSAWMPINLSCTICRARMTSMFFSNTNSMDDRPEIDCERIPDGQPRTRRSASPLRAAS